MSQHYSDVERESDEHSLPDVETWEAQYCDCPECGNLVLTTDESSVACPECGFLFHINNDAPSGWFYWFCLPGCIPDSDPIGPFDSEDEALADAREGA